MYAFFGAAPDTPNRGVSALFRCVVEGIGTALQESELLVFDNGIGRREDSVRLESGAEYAFDRVGARGGKRYYAKENLATMALFASLGRSFGGVHPVIRTLDRCDAILDVSGGDSFSDIYGGKQFWSVIRPKLIAKRRGIPLVLLPQTYGPFKADESRRVAREAVRGATLAWARDHYSYDALKDLLGSEFDPARHRQGVDMAFNLRAVDPGDKLSPEIRRWIGEKAEHPLIGVNVSGLIGLDMDWSRRRFGLRANYIEAHCDFIREALKEPDLRLLLIPHVMSIDPPACERILRELPSNLAPRIRIAPADLDECEVKWLISKMDWFSGTRMHATIAALSSFVPAAATAYSDKTRGVFASCGVEEQVIDPRELDTHTVTERLLHSFRGRDRIQQQLYTTIGGVKARATEQFEDITEILKALV
jgi:polysaccharide pyruvyl transferase WcaK-like protein